MFGLEHPLYAFITAVIVTDLLPSQTRHLGLKRIIATIVGAVCGAVLSPPVVVTVFVAWQSRRHGAGQRPEARNADLVP